MNKKLPLFNIKKHAFACFVSLLLTGNFSFAQTTLFSDYYNRDTTVLSPGGTPNVTYISTLGATGSVTTAMSATAPATINDLNGENDYRLKIGGGTTAGVQMLISSFAGISGYNPVLNQNALPITWSFNIRHNRNTTTLSGFAPGKYGVAAIIACDNANPQATTAKGYALVMGDVGGVAGSTYDLVSFTGGIMDTGTAAPYTSTLTSIITGMTLTGIRDVLSVQINYNPSNNTWSMLQKDDPSPATGTAAVYADPALANIVCGAGSVTDTAGFVANSLPNFGYLLNNNTTSVNLYIDHFKLFKGIASASVYYLTSNSDASNVANWGTNLDGTGMHPVNFTADNQIFKIVNTGATISAPWVVSGSASLVQLGDGTVANTLTIPASASYTGVLNISSNATLIDSSLTSNYTINTIDANSTVTYNGSDSQNVASATYGNLNILTQGTNGANAAGVISVLGNFNISSGSIFNMGSSKLASVNTLTGSGSLKTKNPNSTALPAGITWPFDVYYNYTSANTIQTIALGTYTNLDTTGATTGSPRNFPSDFSVSGNFVTGLGTLTAQNGTANPTPAPTRITFNGTAAQVIPNFPPAAALIIANSSLAGVSLSAQEVVPDTTNLELAGNLKADYTENMGTLSLIDNSLISLGATPHALVFANSSASSPGPADFWMAGKTLTIKGWTGTPGASGTNGQLFVGLDATGLTATQLAQITFEGYTGAMILSTGELVPASSMNTISNELVNFKFAPNPVTDKITLSNSDEISNVTVYNLMGQKVLSFIPNQLITSIDMSSLNPSAYFVEVISQGKKATIKVIKE